MKRVTVLFDDDQLYRDVKAEAAREGRPVKDVIAEALRAWLRERGRTRSDDTETIRRQRLEALARLDEIRKRMPPSDETAEELIRRLRDERVDELLSRVSEGEPAEYDPDAGN